MRTTILATTLLIAALGASPVRGADVHIGIDIGVPPPVYRFDAPPRLVVVPGVPTVRYAPNVRVNFFAYGDRYYTYHEGAWFVAGDTYGPWSYVEPRYVPAPVLRVPVRYYHVAPRFHGGHYGKTRYHRGHGGWKHKGGKGHHKHRH